MAMEKQFKMSIHQKPTGELYITTEHLNSTGSVGIKRGEYLPKNRVLIYPAIWGKRKAAEILTRSILEQQEKIISQATQYRSELQDLMKIVEGMED